MLKSVRNGDTVLIADDNEGIRELLSEILSDEGYHVVAVNDGDQALNQLRRKQFDLALLDIIMPGLTGVAVCQAVKSDPETCLTPVILVTGLSGHKDKIQGIESGADDFINKPVNKEELLARVRSLVRIKHFTDELENAETVLLSLALSIEAKDPYTQGHCDRLAQYAVALANRLGLPADQKVALRRGGIVHDIGKVAVPEHILLKPSPLTLEERKIMEQHTVVGERICAPLRSFRDVLPIIRHHHERLDGSGYPDGLKGDQIPLTVRILATVDVYDSLTTERPYRKALSQDDAFVEMRKEVQKGWRDGSLVDEFEALLQMSALARG